MPLKKVERTQRSTCVDDDHDDEETSTHSLCESRAQEKIDDDEGWVVIMDSSSLVCVCVESSEFAFVNFARFLENVRPIPSDWLK
jgi:hypothetical protein